jgi:acyl-coenzyme A thioesterase PaaI-like protein
VIHGGIQAVMLDEAIGFAVHAHHETIEGIDLAERVDVVTVEFDLRYRRPAPAGTELVVRGEVLRHTGRDYLAVGEIADDSGDIHTSATARWRRLR